MYFYYPPAMKALLLLVFLHINLNIYSQDNVKLEQIQTVDFKTTAAEIAILPETNTVKGKMIYSLEVIKNTDSIYIDAQNMEFENVLLNGEKVNYYYNKSKIWLISDFRSSDIDTISFNYTASPRQAMYFINWQYSDQNVRKQVWTQGQGKNTSHWMPVVDDMREKTIFDLKISFRNGYDVFANGEFQDKLTLDNNPTQWHYKMQQPISSYLAAVAIGEYRLKSERSKSGIPLELYYYPEDSLKVSSTYKHTKKIFDFLEKEIGAPYPWQNYKQLPVQDFLYTGMENTSITLFADMMMVDSIGFNDRNYISVNAHELAHQWFGNLITERSGKDHWLQEGFATYYALLAERDIFGEDYYYWKLYESAEQLKALSDKGKGELLVSPRSSSITYYQKGAWALHMLRERVGDAIFKMAIQNYLEKYKFSNVTTANFMEEVELLYGNKLDGFKKNWLQQTAFQGTAALNSLKKSKFITDYLKIAALRETPLINKQEILREALDFPVNDYIGQEVIIQLSGQKSLIARELYKKAFQSGNLYVRQAIAASIKNIPDGLKTNFEELLKDHSYLTKEQALMELWLRYPDKIQNYLNVTSNVQGFSNKNVRLLWLTLNLVSPAVDAEKSEIYYKELSSYTYPSYPFELRQNAFGYLYQIDTFTDQNLVDLVQGAQHYNYRFRDYCRDLLYKLLENQVYREKYVALLDSLKEVDKEFLNKKLKI